jgi:chromosome segregation protein
MAGPACVTDDERTAYANDLVEACRAKGLNAIAIVFPGIELTLAVPCQAILILDADFEDNRFGAVLTALAINPAPDGDSKTAETTRLENIQSLRTLKEKLDEHV